MTSALDQKLQSYFVQLSEAEKISVVQMIKTFAEDIVDKLGNLYPRRRIPRDTVYLLSENGCNHQPPHSDWDPAQLMKVVKDDGIFGGYPAGAIVALENNTYFNVWVGAIGVDVREMDKKKKKKVYPYRQLKLDSGDLLLFRADLIHSGSAFSESNLRIHCFMDSPNIKRTGNATYDMVGYANLDPIKN